MQEFQRKFLEIGQCKYVGEYLHRACTVCYFSNMVTHKGLALTHLPKLPPKEREALGTTLVQTSLLP